MAFLTSQLPVVFGYLDPGSGSLLLQVLIAGLFSGLFFMKTSLQNLRLCFGRRFRNHL